MSLDEDQVLTASKEYDFECVQWLSLVSMDLRDICVLSQCPNLVELDISKNRIFSLRGLEGQKNLRVLNAAYNKVSDLSKLEGCVRLEKLLLEGNEVMSLDSLPELPKLRQLSLRVGSEGLNPVYEDPQYSSPEAAEAELLRIVFERFPTVFLFNGAHTTFAKSAAEVLLDLVGPPPNKDDASKDEEKDWLAGFEWGEYFDPEKFPASYRPIEHEVEGLIEEIKTLDEKAAAKLVEVARSGEQ